MEFFDGTGLAGSSIVLQPLPAQSAVRVRGKFFSRDGRKFTLKATRLPGVTGSLDIGDKLVLRRRLEEAARNGVNTLILGPEQAEAALVVAGQAGLLAVVEIAIGKPDPNSSDGARQAVARAAQAVNRLRGYPELIGFMFDCAIDWNVLAPAVADAMRAELRALVHSIHDWRGDRLVGFTRRLDALTTVAPAVTENFGEDFICVKLPGGGPTRPESAEIIELHRLAGTHPLVIELGAELPGQREAAAHAFGLGVAGVVAAAMRRVASSGWQSGRMLSAGELQPFADAVDTAAKRAAAAPMVSVVVLARDNVSTVAACLEAIGRLSYPNYEVIVVVDEGSGDRTASAAEAIRVAPSVRIIRRSRSAIAAAYNAATRAAHGQFIAFTGADCVVDPDWLAISLRVIEACSLDACSGPICSRTVPAHSAARAIAALAASASRYDADDPATMLDVRNMVVRRSALIAAGGFDPRFVGEGAEADLAARLLEAGFVLGWCPAGFVWREETVGIGEFYRRCIRRGRAGAMLAREHPGRFAAVPQRVRRLAVLPSDGERGLVRGLCRLFALSGSIAGALASRHYTLACRPGAKAAGRERPAGVDSPGDLAVGANGVHAAHPAAHR